MKMQILLFGLAIACPLVTQLGAQPAQITPQKVIPPSPDAAALGKYGSTPVGLNTGIPSIDIPIYTVAEGSLQLPVSISYHASGIKVSEIASWVGLGWALNAGGAVSRSVVGKSDEQGFFETVVKSASQITQSDFEFLKPFADGAGDYESDYYFYNFNGHSGKFVYRQNDHATPFLIPQSPIRISRDSYSFWIVDENGTTYTFSWRERTEVPGPVVMEEITSAYYLTSITSADGKDTITLFYTQDNPYSEGAATFSETIGQDCTSAGTPTSGYHTTNWMTSGRTIYPVRLSEIRFKTGKLKFIPDATRDDLPDGTRLAEIQLIAKNSDGSYEATPRKRFVLGETYFGAGANSRLKLAYLEERDKLNTLVKRHSFQYFDSPALPQRSSLAQDWWGFYNGKNSNSSLIASELIGFGNTAYQVGNADREPSAASMVAGTLNRIDYPTGGYTEFSYEPHYYLGVKDSVVVVEALSGEIGNTTDYLQDIKSFTPPTSGWYTLQTYCSDVTDANETFFSRVFLRKPGIVPYLVEHYYTPYEYNPFGPHLYKDYNVYLEAGQTYEIVAQSKGNSTSDQFLGAAFARGTLAYTIPVQNAKLMAGGLRIKEIRDYESSLAAPISKIYKYGDGDGTGTLLIPKYGLSNAKQEIEIHWYQQSGNGAQTRCLPVCFPKRLMISGTAALELTALNGAPVVYDQVTVYDNSATALNGRTVHKFSVQEDEFTYAPKVYNNGRWQMNKSWRGGDEVSKTVYHSNTNIPIQRDTAAYDIFNSEEIIGTKIGWKVQAEGCSPSNLTEEELFGRLYYFDVPFDTGLKKISVSGTKTYSSDDPAKFVESTTSYAYNNLNSNHQQLSTRTTNVSDGDVYETHYWYAADYLTTVDNMQSLLGAHIIATPIKEETHRAGNIIAGKVTRLDDYGRPIEIRQYESATLQAASAHNSSVLFPAGYTKSIDITYDANTRNIVGTQMKDNIKTSYLWGYNNSLPVAEVTNGEASRARHTSFEEDGVVHDEAKTGSRVWSGVFNLLLPEFSGDYLLSYWEKTGSNPWTLIPDTVTVTAPGQSINIGTAGSFIDEVRLLPPGSRMTTYTYDPVIGLTSATDFNQSTTYYEYDNSGRLQFVKDLDKNVVKRYSYHYKQ